MSIIVILILIAVVAIVAWLLGVFDSENNMEW